MAKFVIVNKAPDQVRKDEYVIESPTFLKEVKDSAKTAQRGNITGTNQLRSIVGLIGERYDNNLTAWTIKPHLYEGRRYKDDEELSGIILEILRSQYPAIFASYLDSQIKLRPNGTKLVYYVGNLTDTTPFFSNGIDMIEEKDVDSYLGIKAKRVFGKPAITKEEAEQD